MTLTRMQTPRDPGARVESIYEAAPARRPLTRNEREMAELRRRLEANPHLPFEAILVQLKIECGYRPSALWWEQVAV